MEKETTKCWSWIGQHDADGRPIFRGEKAYRVMYELRKGDIPAEFHMHHRCKNSSCVNPRHLVALSPEAIDRSVQPALVLLCLLAFSLYLIAIESQVKSPIPGMKIPRWQLDEIAKHRRLRRKTEPKKIVWTRTSERVAMTEFPNH